MKDISRRSVLPLIAAVLAAPILISAKKSGRSSSALHILPEALKAGDVVGICAPAGATHDSKENETFIQVLYALGFKVKTSGNLATQFGYFSDTDEARANAFMDLIEDKAVKAIFFTRGGWGCARLLPLIDFDKIQQNPKIILGFSDITSLLVAITHKTGIFTFHGPNGNASWDDFSWRSVESHVMKGALETMRCTALNRYPIPPKCITRGIAKGELYGGNLSVLTALLGTGYLPDWQGKILFFEEVSEEPYRIDRMLTQWRQNGVFDQISGLVIGQFKKCLPEDSVWSFSIDDVFDQHFKHAKFPVFSGFLCGHIVDKFTLPIGQMVEIDASDFSIQVLAASVNKM